MDTRNNITYEEAVGSPSPNDIVDEGHEEWVREQVMLAIKEGQKNPDSYISEEEIWKKYGFSD